MKNQVRTTRIVELVLERPIPTPIGTIATVQAPYTAELVGDQYHVRHPQHPTWLVTIHASRALYAVCNCI